MQNKKNRRETERERERDRDREREREREIQRERKRMWGERVGEDTKEERLGFFWAGKREGGELQGERE